jgi:hypothetical protein
LNLPYRGGQFSIRGFNIPWMKIDPGVNLPWGSKYHMTPGHNIMNDSIAVTKVDKASYRSADDYRYD